MKINPTNNKPTNFENNFYNVTRELDASVPLSRALIDVVGTDIPWIVMSNNSQERKERARKLSVVFSVAYLSPFLTLPLSNRFAMKNVGKLTNDFWSNNHKAIHISNEFLKNSDDMIKELRNMSKKTPRGPIETVYNKFNKSNYEQKIDIDQLLKSCNGDKELLRQKILKSKNAVFVSDCYFSFGTMGIFPFLSNEITKNESGQTGFSAEMNMADKEIVEKRAKDYEKNKQKKFMTFCTILTGMALGCTTASHGALLSEKSNKIIKYLKNNAKAFDYTKGIYMNRLPLLLGSITAQLGFVLASRNKTEQKDNTIRYGVGDAVFFGGDLALGSMMYGISDKVFDTKLTKNNEKNTSVLRKMFPETKSIKQIIEEADSGKIALKNKKIASSIFWGNLGVIALTMGYAIPKIVNKMIKSDVEKYSDELNEFDKSEYNKNLEFLYR
ncbi:MAG: hypothetical protein R3Y28_04815 [Candidatus Gastranaerophilales bacterium]